MLDLKDGCFNIPSDPQLKKHFCFALGNKRFSFTRLIYGFICSPMLFHSIISRVMDWGKKKDANVKFGHYINDIKILHLLCGSIINK